MVRIGYDKKFSENDISNFLNTFEISIIEGSKDLIEDFEYVEIETKILSQRGFCCLGNLIEIRNNNININQYKCIPIRNKLVEIRNMYQQDIKNWMNFINSFVKKYKSIAINRYYPDVKINNGIIIKKLDELKKEDLLTLDINQTILISLY